MKVRTDDWYNPTPRTEIHTEAEFSTAFLTYYGQGSAGYDFFNNAIFIGPDLATLGDERFTQLGAGIADRDKNKEHPDRSLWRLRQ